MSARKVVIAALVCLVACASWGGAAFAQSTSSDDPMPLTSGVADGEVEPGGQSHYYSFVGGPGNVTLAVSGSTEYGSSGINVTISDEQSAQLANFVVSASSDGAKAAKTLHLNKRQRLKVQLLFGLDVGARVKYKVQVGGAVATGNGASAATPIASAGVPTGRANTVSGGGGQNYDGVREAPHTVAPVAAKPTVAVVPPNPVVTTRPATGSVAGDIEQELINTPIEDKWALIIGVSKFQKEAINLKYPAKDARDLYNYLIKEGNFASDHVKLIVDEQATKERVLAEIGDKWLPRLARPNDLVLIFVSTHGSPSKADLEGLNYLVMHNTDPDSLYATGLPLQELATAIRQRVHAKRVVLIVDACHSGAANPAKGLARVGNFDSDALSQGSGQLVICSSEPDQVSWESTRYENGVFTHQLIEALRAGAGKANLDQVFERLRDAVLSEVMHDRKEVQSPVFKRKWKGNELILSAPPAKPRSVPDDLKGNVQR